MQPQEYTSLLREELSRLNAAKIEDLVALIKETQSQNKTIYAFGNGGSGANASHFVQDLLKCPVKDFESSEGRYRVLCLNDNTPVLMAYANDMSYEQVFRQQLMNFCQPGDLVIGISGSGNSMNVVKAIEYANQSGAETFAIVGFSGGKLLPAAKQSLHFQTDNMQLYEDLCMIALHSVVTALKA